MNCKVGRRRLSCVSIVHFYHFVNQEEVLALIGQVEASKKRPLSPVFQAQAEIHLDGLKTGFMLLSHPEVVRRVHDFEREWLLYLNSLGEEADEQAVAESFVIDKAPAGLKAAWEELEKVTVPVIRTWIAAGNATPSRSPEARQKEAAK